MSKVKVVFELSEVTNNDATSIQKAIHTILSKLREMPHLELEKLCTVREDKEDKA